MSGDRDRRAGRGGIDGVRLTARISGFAVIVVAAAVAPSTAIAFLVCVAILLMRDAHVWSRPFRVLCVGVSAASAVFGLAAFLDAVFRFGIDVEDWRMPAATGLTFFVAGIASMMLWGGRAGEGPASRSRGLVGGLGLLVGVIGGGIVLGHLRGTPLGYLSTTEPMSLTVAVGFTMLGLCIVAVAGRSSFPLRSVIGDSQRARLMRVFVPLTVVPLLIWDVFASRMARIVGAEDAVLLAVFGSTYAIAAVVVVARVAGSVSGRLDRSSLESMRLLAETQRIARVGGWEFDVATGRLTWTEETRRIYGVGPDHVPEDVDHAGHYAPADAPTVERAFKRCVEIGEPYDLEVEFVRESGEHIFVRTTGTAIVENERVVRAGGYLMDITERKRAEEGLRRTSAYLESLLDYANAPIIVWDPDQRITRFNHAFERLTDLASDEVIGERLSLLFPDDSREASLALIDRAIGGESWESVEIPILRADGEVRVVLWNSASIRETGGALVAVIAQGQDITERKRAEEGLRRTSAYLESLLDYANAPIIVWDPDQRITRFNHAFERLTDLASDEVIGERLSLLFPDDSREVSLALIDRAIGGESWESVEIPILRADGEVRVVLWNSASIRETGGALVAVIAQGQDITERKRAEDQVVRLNADLRNRASALEAVNAELEAFNYSVSHDLRAPLRAINGFSLAVLEDQGDRLHPEGRADLERVRAAAVKMGELIDALLGLSRLSRGEMEVGDVDLSSIARDVTAALQAQEPDRSVEFSIEDGVHVRGDADLLTSVMQNLLSNAWKFTGRRDSALIEFGVTEANGERVHFVRDNGAGFDDAYAGKLFSAFQRLHGQEDFPGIGIGLAIVGRVVRRHGGRVWAEGGVGKGATFYFTLS